MPNRLFGEGCLSGDVALHIGASSRAILFGTEAEEPEREWQVFLPFSGGTRTGGNGFGSFCRNKRTSSAGAKPCIIKFLNQDSLIVV